jgi:hypothetical protein
MTMAEEQTTEPGADAKLAVGLDHLGDETLARIVEDEIEQHGGLKSVEARVAFAELARRSGHDIRS